MQSPSRMLKSTRTSSESLESAVSAEVHTLQVRQESKRKRECRGRKFPSDRKVARRGNRFVVIAVRVSLRARGDHPTDRRRSIQSGKLSRTPARARSFVDRNRKCI